jgi:Uma2 family endonuclease
MSTKTVMSIQEFERLPDDSMRHELNHRELITMPPPRFRHSAAVAALFLELGSACRNSRRFKVYAEAGCLLSADTVRQPDLAVVKSEGLDRIDPGGYLAGAPEIAIEVAPPSNSQDEFEEKMSQYFAHGALQVWVIYPMARHVHIFEAGTSSPRILAESDTVTLDLLPGWSMPVSAIFE